MSISHKISTKILVLNLCWYLKQQTTKYESHQITSTCSFIILIPRLVFNLRIRQRLREIIWYAYASVYLLLKKKKTFTFMHQTHSYQLLKANAYSRRSVSHWKLQTLQNLFTYPTNPKQTPYLALLASFILARSKYLQMNPNNADMKCSTQHSDSNMRG